MLNIVYNLLISFYWLRRFKLWGYLWSNFVLRNSDKEGYFVIHGKKVKVNIGYPYGLVSRIYKTFNNPLLELVYLTSKLNNKRVNITRFI